MPFEDRRNFPAGRRISSDPRPAPSLPARHGESCGTVEAVNNGWFTMGHGAVSQQGDSGGPVYLTNGPGPARIVGIFNSVWGGFPAAVSWQSTTQEIRQDVGVGGPAI